MDSNNGKITGIILTVVSVILTAVIAVVFINQNLGKKTSKPETQTSITQTTVNLVVKTKEEEKAALKEMYRFEKNSELLKWNIDEPSSWEGITYNSNGNVSEIELPYLDIEGKLDLSGFSCLESVNLMMNKLTEVDLSGCAQLVSLNISSNFLTTLNVSDCKKLKSFDCSFNDFSKGGIDVSANTALVEFKCDDCKLNSIDVSSLTSLKELSCAFNKLTTINIDNNKALTSITCCYNYLDTHEGGELYKKFDDLKFSDVYVNYYPQAVPEKAEYNSAELKALKSFVFSNSNSKELDWLDKNGNLDTEKLQNNVLFEFDGNEYRIVAIDIADTEVTGELKLSDFTKLQELYCENTKLTYLDLKGCTALTTLDCSNSLIKTLVLPKNAAEINTPLYKVDCELNYIDTSIFTDEIVKSITFKAGAELAYEEQK